MARPYEGLFVLDAAQGIAGPYCGMLLALCGATVIKLEPPKGDWLGRTRWRTCWRTYRQPHLKMMGQWTRAKGRSSCGGFRA